VLAKNRIRLSIRYLTDYSVKVKKNENGIYKFRLVGLPKRKFGRPTSYLILAKEKSTDLKERQI